MFSFKAPLTLFLFAQTVLAPPDVQQQYLSSIQHLLGDGKIPVCWKHVSIIEEGFK
jgi:hypothetical protein